MSRLRASHSGAQGHGRAARIPTQALACVFTVMLGGLVFGQASFNTSIQTTDFSGEWTEIPHEIGFTAELYDYSGLPVNAAGRMRYETGDISEWSIPEFVCRPHPGVYNWFYGGGTANGLADRDYLQLNVSYDF